MGHPAVIVPDEAALPHGHSVADWPLITTHARSTSSDLSAVADAVRHFFLAPLVIDRRLARGIARGNPRPCDIPPVGYVHASTSNVQRATDRHSGATSRVDPSKTSRSGV
jgi:hypothetical protein